MSTQDLLNIIDKGVEIIDLSWPMFKGMPQSMRHPSFEHVIARRHGDAGAVRCDGSSGANDLIVTGTHLSTHIDALAHISQDGKLYGGADANEAQCSGKFTVHGAETIAPFFTKGVFLDIPKLKGLEVLPAAYEITADDLQAAAEAEGIELTSGCVVLIRTGWAQHWPDRETFEGGSAGVPGVGGEAAAWLASYSPRACGIDTIAFDPVPVAAETLFLQPAHRILIVENGIHLIETMNLEELSRRGVYEFLFVLSSLRLVGATGAPARPLAIIGHSSLAEG